MIKPTLTYIRKCTKNDLPSKGFIYLHHWGTGWQHLVFENKLTDADKDRILAPAEKF